MVLLLQSLIGALGFLSNDSVQLPHSPRLYLKQAYLDGYDF